MKKFFITEKKKKRNRWEEEEISLRVNKDFLKGNGSDIRKQLTLLSA